MYLKRVHISGFKSFADNIKLDFEPGLIGIVGPNGCGKSNITDAIRWCLGEMSAKSLRSSLMMDVIFNGSGKRPASNLSEVTLTFDNTSKTLPIDYDDVSITRKLFRSGESEYYINKTQCRLRDIRELFLDTGMGEDGYSSMAQGKVEWILNAKPEDRRELFEEAAGVSKYRARREEAMRKLDKVEIDLSRLADIISVTSDQIRKLENAVNRAKTYQRVRDELKTMEISDWLYQVDTSSEQLKQVQERLQTARNQAETMNTEVHTLDAELAEIRLKNTETEEKLLTANQRLAQVDAQIKISEERLASAEARQIEQERQIENITHAISREKGRMQELAHQESIQREALQKIEEEGKSIESDYESSKASYESSLATLEQKKNDVKTIRDQILNQAQERSKLQNRMSQLASDVSRLESEREARERDLNRVNAQVEELGRIAENTEKQLNEFQEIAAQKKSRTEGLTEELRQTGESETTLRGQILKKSEEIAQLKGQIESIKSEQSRDPYLSGLNAVIEAQIPGILGPVGRLVEASASDRDLLAAALGEHLGDLVALTSENAQEAIRFLSENHKGRARIWILDQIPEPQAGFNSEAMTPLIQRIQPINGTAGLFQFLLNGVSIQEGHLWGRGYLNGGVDASEWKSHVPHRVPELEEKLAGFESEKSELESALHQTQEKKQSLMNDREQSIKEIEQIRIRIEVAQEEKNKLSDRLSLLTQEQSVLAKEIEESHQHRTQAQNSLEEGKQKFEQLQNEEKEAHHLLDIRGQELAELQQLNAQLSAELSSKTERHNSFVEKRNWQQSIIAQNEKDRDAAQANLQHHEDSLNRSQAELENAKNTQSQSREEIQSGLTARQEASASVQEVQALRAELSEKIGSLDKSLHEKRDALDVLHETIQTESINENTIKNREETIRQKLIDQYDMSWDQAREQFQPQQAEIEPLEKLKKRVSNMGPVNLAAPQEHAELMEKYNFLSSQQADLLKAKGDLREVISKINSTTREHFRDTFTKVRANFRTIYSTLFQGGEADLHLTNEADILSSGIDIFCQPPGKKLLHISLMSGGEKALTAVALLFAFFQVRPSPLALLDEVDAPLDDANVVRYVRMIKNFAQKSQFLVITHNKLTMEAANTLYGVTMEEQGVSKVLSARIAAREVKSVANEPAHAG